MATSRAPPFDLDLTIVSAKHLKNVNWRNGDLKPYVVFWVDPDRRIATKSDDAGSTKPVWNERFTVPLSPPLADAALTLEVFHSKPSETPKPLVGTLRVRLDDLPDPDDFDRVRTFQLSRPSGRPQGKMRVKLAVRERPLPPPPDYHMAPPSSYYYSTAPPPPPHGPSPVPDYRGYAPSPSPSQLPPPPPPPTSYHYGSYPDSYSGYYPGYYSAPPPPPPRPFLERQPQQSYSGPSAPVDYSQYEQKPKKMGLGTGLAVGAVAGAMGGLALEEGLKYEEQKIADRVESDLASRDNYSDYRSDY